MRKDPDLTLDEVLGRKCAHDVPFIIVCPKCEPEKYKVTPQILEAARKVADVYEAEKGICLHDPPCKIVKE